MEELSRRQQRERRHHDELARELEPAELLVEESFEAATALENRFVLDYVGDLEGRRVLDLGAGAGEASLYFASRGARVTSLDISVGQLGLIGGAARRRGVAVERVAVPAESLPFQDGAFDLVYGYGVLHHVDYRQALPEVLRVLAPGGRVAFVEPLAYNPVIWVYRLMAGGWRTEDEFPFSRKAIRWVTRQLERGDHREFWLAALWLFVYFWIGERVSPAKDRYWKKVLRDAPRYERILRPLLAIDRVLSRLPGIRLLAYNTVMFGQKPAAPDAAPAAVPGASGGDAKLRGSLAPARAAGGVLAEGDAKPEPMVVG